MDTKAYLFDDKNKDSQITLKPNTLKNLKQDQLLWFRTSCGEDVSYLKDFFPVGDAALENTCTTTGRPFLKEYGTYFHLRVFTPKYDRKENKYHKRADDFIVGENFVISIHSEKNFEEKGFLKTMQDDTDFGLLSGPLFLTAMLEGHLSDYFLCLEELEEDLDEFDEDLLRDRISDQEKALERLANIRHLSGSLRKILVSHRDIYAQLSHPHIGALTKDEQSDHFSNMYARLERAIEASETVREMIVGSFDILMAKASQQTNDTMQLLTIITLTLLPASLLAGILGMNFTAATIFKGSNNVGLFISLGVMLVMMAGTIFFAKHKKWF